MSGEASTCRTSTGFRVSGALLAVVVVFLCSLAPVVAGTLDVPSETYPTIQSAIVAAAPGDVVLVQPGTYRENINFKGKAITVTSTNPDDPNVVATTVMDGQQLSSVVTFYSGETATSVLTGFTIQNGKALRGGGVRCLSSSPTITNNAMTDNFASGDGGGISCWVASSPEIAHNILSRNTGGAISCYFSSSPRITGNTISENSGGAVYLWDSSPAIENNVITKHSAGIAIFLGGQSSAVITGNIVSESRQAITLRSNSSATITGNTISGNRSSWGPGINCLSFGSVTIANNRIVGNHADESGSAISYANGLSMTITGNTITGNTARKSPGIECGAGSGTVTGNLITENSAELGQVISCGTGASVTISENTVTRNSVPFSIFCSRCSAHITSNTISDNSGDGIRCDSSLVDITSNTVESNGGAGVAVVSGTRVAIRSNSIFGNGGLGINLGYDGVTPNDPGDGDTGANNLQNFPELLVAYSKGGSITIVGMLDSTPGTSFTLEFFANSSPDPSGYGEGETPIGSTTATTDGTGLAKFLVTFPVGGATFITATATDPKGNTSEFSAVSPVPSEVVQDVVAEVEELNLQQGIANSLDTKLDAVLTALDDVNEHNDVAAINSLGAFINAVEAQRGRKIPEADADALIAHAQAIIAALNSK